MRLWIIPVAAVIGFAVGCNKSPEGGTPGTDSSFTLTGPTIPTSIKQDNKESVEVSVKRGDDFKKDVKLKVEAPDKLKVELNKDTIKPSDANPGKVMLTIAPAKDAPVGDHKVRVTGTPDGGGTPTTVEFVVKVTEAE